MKKRARKRSGLAGMTTGDMAAFGIQWEGGEKHEPNHDYSDEHDDRAAEAA